MTGPHRVHSVRDVRLWETVVRPILECRDRFPEGHWRASAAEVQARRMLEVVGALQRELSAQELGEGARETAEPRAVPAAESPRPAM